MFKELILDSKWFYSLATLEAFFPLNPDSLEKIFRTSARLCFLKITGIASNKSNGVLISAANE